MENTERLKLEAEKAISAYITELSRDMPPTKVIKAATIITTHKDELGVHALIAMILTEDVPYPESKS